MRTLLWRLGHEDAGSHLFEFALLGGGALIAILKPHLFVTAFYRLADFVNLFVSQVTAFF